VLELSAPSPAEIEAHLGDSQPVVFRQGARHWPAMRWTWASVRDLGTEVAVRCEVGDAMQGTNSHVDTTLAMYMDTVASGAAPASTYLSQFELLARLPALRDDLDFSVLRGRLGRTLAWIGPGGTFTGLHCDHLDNLVVQVVGRKRFRLAAPEVRPKLYPSKKYDFFSELSGVDARRPDLAAHPAFADVAFEDVVLEPGDMLCTPTDWWHCVEALEPSITVNRFNLSPLRTVGRSWQFVRHGLHLAGVYRRSWCTCHARGPAR
jgi:hypothetical protein